MSENRTTHQVTPVVNSAYPVRLRFCRGFASIKNGGKWGLIDRKGQIVVPAEYGPIEPFSEGLACVVQNGLIGYLRTNNSFAIEPRYEKGESFSEGLALVGLKGKKGFIDAQGRTVIPSWFKSRP